MKEMQLNQKINKTPKSRLAMMLLTQVSEHLYNLLYWEPILFSNMILVMMNANNFMLVKRKLLLHHLKMLNFQSLPKENAELD